MAKENGVENVFVHAFTDGRDVDPRSALEFIEDVENYMKEVGVGKIASVSGRYYAMDRDKRWERVQLAYDAMVNGKGNTATSAKEAIEKSYADDKNDEFVVPTVIVEDGKPLGLIKEGDSIVFGNFRPDRAREITRAIVDTDFVTCTCFGGYQNNTVGSTCTIDGTRSSVFQNRDVFNVQRIYGIQ